MTDVATAAPSPPLRMNAHLRLAAVLAVLVAMADWLFYGRLIGTIGISGVLFLVAIAAGAVVANAENATLAPIPSGAAIMAVGLLPFILETGPIAFLMAVFGTALFVCVATDQAAPKWAETAQRAAVLLASMLWRAFPDLIRMGKSAPSAKPMLRKLSLVGWIVPLGLGGIFLALFADANPLIEDWLKAINPRALLDRVSVPRLSFWIFIIALVWPLVLRRSWQSRAARQRTEDVATPPDGALAGVAPAIVPNRLFDKAVILRSLVIFNALFAVQTALDVFYLWGGAALPHSMNYASYAHRGAYPLIVTALLAAAFIIVATQPGTGAERSRPVRALVFLWVAQNVALVVSSILRLDLYVEIYALSYWRVAAFIWMMIVALGLLLIVARILLGRSNGWLIRVNLGTVAAVLYACSCVNFADVIARHNVQHSREVSGRGVPLDTRYLLSLGPHALPALDAFAASRPYDARTREQRDRIARCHLNTQENWRAWSYRDGQLALYLRRVPDWPSLPPPPL